jgi:hypothetical protein
MLKAYINCLHIQNYSPLESSQRELFKFIRIIKQFAMVNENGTKRCGGGRQQNAV